MKIYLLHEINIVVQCLHQKASRQMVMKPTCDIRTLIDYVYVTKTVKIATDVTDCYYSDHDCVLCAISI